MPSLVKEEKKKADTYYTTRRRRDEKKSLKKKTNRDLSFRLSNLKVILSLNRTRLVERDRL